MDKKEYSRIMVNLINKRIFSSDIQYIKKYANLNEMLKILSIMNKTTRNTKSFQHKANSYDNIIHPRFPHIFTGQLREDIMEKEIEGELRFLTAQIVMESNKITNFINIRNEFECLFMSGHYEQAINKVELFEKENGFSFWSLDCNVLGRSYYSVNRVDKFCKKTIHECSNLPIETYIKISKYRFLKDITMPFFNAQFDNYMQKFNETEPNSNFKEAFKRYIVANIDIARGMDYSDIRYLLIIANYLPLFDCYCILEQVIGWLCSESIYENKKINECIIECALLLRENINVPF